MKQKLSTPARLGFFFGGLLIYFLIASLLFNLHWSVRFLIGLPAAIASGIGMYGFFPTKGNIEAYKVYLRSQFQYGEADSVHIYDWLIVVAIAIGVHLFVQLVATWFM